MYIVEEKIVIKHHCSRCGRIVICADDKLLAHTLMGALCDLNFDLRYATIDELNGQFSLDGVDIIVLCDGWPLLVANSWLRKLVSLRHAPQLFVVSRYCDAQRCLSLFECGVTQIFSMPIALHRFRSKIVGCCGRCQL